MGLPALATDERQQAEEARTVAVSLPDEARKLTITDAASLEDAAIFLGEVKRRRQLIAERCRPLREATHRAHKEAVALETEADRPAAEAERIVKAEVARYHEEQRRLRAELERQAAEERRRLELEAQRKAAAEQKRQQALAEEARLREAEEAERAGDAERAEALVSAPVVVAPVAPEPVAPVAVVVPEAPKAQGVSVRMEWKWRITDPKAIDRHYLMVDEKKINSVVRSLGKDAEDAIGGISCYEAPIVSARASTMR